MRLSRTIYETTEDLDMIQNQPTQFFGFVYTAGPKTGQKHEL